MSEDSTGLEVVALAALDVAEAARAVVDAQGPYPLEDDDDVEHWRVGSAYAYRLRQALDKYQRLSL